MLEPVRLVDSILDEIDAAFAVTLDRDWSRLYGGDESAVFRCGDIVVRVGPTWRTDAELEWSNEVALAAAELVAEVVAPLTRPDGSTVIRIDDRPVTLWPYVEGEPGDNGDPVQRAQAAELLARVHRALATRPWSQPPSGLVLAPTPDLADPDLDTWLAIFERDHPDRIALHGDYDGGNVLLAVDGRIVALLDWDEAFVGPPERELAVAAWEWGDCLDTLDLGPAFEFVDAYCAAGGPARRLGEHDLRQLVRQRLRREAASRRANEPGPSEHEARQLRAYHALRVPSRS